LLRRRARSAERGAQALRASRSALHDPRSSTNPQRANLMSRFLVPLPKVFLRAWSVYPLLVPFYLMGKTPIPGTEKVEGGVPQLADYYLVGVMALVFGVLPFRLR